MSAVMKYCLGLPLRRSRYVSSVEEICEMSVLPAEIDNMDSFILVKDTCHKTTTNSMSKSNIYVNMKVHALMRYIQYLV
jgi:hypothetical protein